MSAVAVVDRFSTGFLHTVVERLDDGSFRWTRSAGPDRPAPLAGPAAHVRRALDKVETGPVSLCLPEPAAGDPSMLQYHTPGSISVAQALLAGPYDDHHGATSPASRVPQAVRGTGHLLRALHVVADPEAVGGVRDQPPGPARLAAWLDRATGPRAAAALHRELRRRLGDERWARLRGWCTQERTPGRDDVLLHGAPGTGSLVLADDPARTVLLTGEDVARGPAGFDLGWLLGEFLELRILATHQGTDASWLDPLPSALLSGYYDSSDGDSSDGDSSDGDSSDGKAPGRGLSGGGPPGATEWVVGRAAVLRVATHAHDFAAYVGWHPELAVLVDGLVEHLDTDGAAALSPVSLERVSHERP